jgi:hypothetical protein
MDNSASGTHFELGAGRMAGKFLATSNKLLVSADSEDDILVDGMGFEPTTPTLRTWCSPN